MAFASVVLPDPVPPTTRMFFCVAMASRITSTGCWFFIDAFARRMTFSRYSGVSGLMMPFSTYSSNIKTLTAFLRNANTGAVTTGGISACRRLPSSGNSPSKIGWSYVIWVCNMLAHVFNMLTAKLASMYSPVNRHPRPAFSVHNLPSGFRAISNTSSSRSAAMNVSPHSRSMLSSSRSLCNCSFLVATMMTDVFQMGYDAIYISHSNTNLQA